MRETNVLEQIPDYLYLFPERVNGELVFFKDAYEAKLTACEAFSGIEWAQVTCVKLIVWREAFHLVGGMLVYCIVHFLSKKLGVIYALALSAVFTTYILFQEFVLHPRAFEQVFFKSVLDSVVWLAPLTVYWTLVCIRRVTLYFKKR